MITWETASVLNLLRILICSVILIYSCVTDWRMRRAPNALWYVMGGAGALLDILELFLRSFDAYMVMSLVLGVVFMYVFVYVIFRIGGFGGADAKSLIAIAILFPYYPVIYLAGSALLPLSAGVRSPIFAFTVLGNAVVLTLVVPIYVLLRNLVTVPGKELKSNLIGSFTGYLMPLEGLRGKHVRLMHVYNENNGVVNKKLVFGGREAEPKVIDRLLRWKEKGLIPEKVWVTPKLPFLIPITIGFLAAVIYGDILMQVVSAFM
jgi:archaeal preflagellin peptidase FlaK